MTLSFLKEKSIAALRWSEQYTKTDMVYLAKGGFWLIFGKGLSLLISFALSIIFAKYWSPEEYGTYKYILSWIGILGIFSLSGIDAAVQQSVARGFDGSFEKGFKTKLKWSVLSSLAACGLAGYYLMHQNYRLAIPILISAAFMPLFCASGLYNGFLIGKKRFNEQTKLNVFNQFIYSLFLAIVLLLTKNLYWMIATYLFTRTILNLFLDWRTKRKFKTNDAESLETIPYGKNLTIMNFISTIAGQLDQILLFTIIGPAQLAIYSFAILGPEKVKEVLKLLNTLALPKFSANNTTNLKSSLMPRFWLLIIFTIPVIIIYVLIAPFFYRLFFPQYTSSILYSQWLSLVIFGFPASLLTTYFQAKIMIKYLYIIKTIFPIIQIVLMIILANLFGVWGVIGAIIANTFISLIIHIILFKKS